TFLTHGFESIGPFVRAVVTPTGGTAHFNVTVVGHDNPQGANSFATPANSTWADFNLAAFYGPDGTPGPFVSKESSLSLPQQSFLFAAETNDDVSDRPDAKPSSINLVMDIDARNVAGQKFPDAAFITYVTNLLTHEIGHLLGSIHYKDHVNEYI